MKRKGFALAGALLLAGCAGQPADANPAPSTSKAATISVYGTVTAPLDITPLMSAEKPTEGDVCKTPSGYDDISRGAQVVVKDESGKTIGVGQLGLGALTPSEGSTLLIAAHCQFKFSIKDVPWVSKFYSVHVGNQNRGDLQYTKEQIAKGLDISIGLK